MFGHDSHEYNNNWPHTKNNWSTTKIIIALTSCIGGTHECRQKKSSLESDESAIRSVCAEDSITTGITMPY